MSDIHAPLHDLLAAGSIGVVYPAVRNPGREAVACFRPAAVANVRPGGRFRLTWSGGPEPEVSELR